MQQLELDYRPYSYQEEVHFDEHRFKVIVGGRRVGKSQLALQELIKHCLTTKNATAWWVGPTYNLAKEIGWETFQDYVETLKPVIASVHHTNLSVKFINGSKLYFKGADKYDSLRGRGLTYCVVDEAAFCHENVWKQAIRPALSDKQGRAILISTPNGRNWFYRQYKNATFSSRTQWTAWHWPSNLNPLLTAQDLEEARSDLSNIDYRQEYLAEFVTKAGLVYDDFSDENVVDDFTFDHDMHDCYLGMDFGYANPTAVCFMAYNRLNGTVTQFEEIYVSRTPINDIIQLIRDRMAEHRVREIKHAYTDPAGNAEELSSGISPVDSMRKAGLSVLNKGSRISPGLALVRSFILNASGQRRFFVHSRCTETIRSLYGYEYKLIHDMATEDPVKDNVHDHACDAVRYFFVNRFDHAKYVANNLDQQSWAKAERRGIKMKKCAKCRKPFPSATKKTEPPFLCKECNDV